MHYISQGCDIVSVLLLSCDIVSVLHCFRNILPNVTLPVFPRRLVGLFLCFDESFPQVINRFSTEFSTKNYSFDLVFL